VLFLARLHPKKGLDILADAFAQLATHHGKAHLVVAGPDGGAQEDFTRRIAQLNLTARVHVVGPLYGRDKFAAMVDAGCFCLPSRQEGFSVAITEALACGLPVVASESCHFPQIVASGAGRVTPLDAAAVAQALRDVLADPSRRAEMGRRGRELVERHFTWPRIAPRMIGAYEEFAQ
jgi:glycosyltransferase involved in cell wall biosynthesis